MNIFRLTAIGYVVGFDFYFEVFFHVSEKERRVEAKSIKLLLKGSYFYYTNIFFTFLNPTNHIISKIRSKIGYLFSVNKQL